MPSDLSQRAQDLVMVTDVGGVRGREVLHEERAPHATSSPAGCRAATPRASRAGRPCSARRPAARAGPCGALPRTSPLPAPAPCPGRCCSRCGGRIRNITSTPEKACSQVPGSVKSSRTASTSGICAATRPGSGSAARTSRPAASRSATTYLPTLPSAPVTRTGLAASHGSVVIYMYRTQTYPAERGNEESPSAGLSLGLPGRGLRPLDLPTPGVRNESEAAVQPSRGIVRLRGDDPALGSAVRSPARRNPHEMPSQASTPVVERRLHALVARDHPALGVVTAQDDPEVRDALIAHERSEERRCAPLRTSRRGCACAPS